MDGFDFEKMAKDIVMGTLKDVAPDAVPAAAAEAARKVIVAAIASTGAKQDPHRTVVDACRGVLGGLLLLEKELPGAAAALLGETAAIAGETNLDPAEMMTWAIEGMAPVCRMAGPDVEGAAHEAIEAKFMGAGEVFAQACRSVGA